MSFLRHALASAAIVAGAVAATTGRCQNITVPVSISAENTVLDMAAPTSNIEITNFVLDRIRTTRQSVTPAPELFTISGQYELAATYCEPDAGPSRVLQVLTHGIGFDRAYWDFPYNNYNYSYVDFALEHGYSTLSYDRLGFGASSHGDPIHEIQSRLQVAALHELTRLVRAGEIADIAARFDRVVHIGHSMGSSLTYALTVADPAISDGIVLTGFSHVRDFTTYAFIAFHLEEPGAGYVDGYVESGDTTALQTTFFPPRNFDPDILDAAFELTQPSTVGEWLTNGGLSGDLNSIAGPVAIVTGERDIDFCGGDCYATGDVDEDSLLDESERQFPETSAFVPIVVNGAGHGLNLDYTWPVSYNNITDFFLQHGLGPQL